MKNILMMHYDLHFYRLPIYEKLIIELRKNDINLLIWPINIQHNGIDFNFEVIEKIMNIKNFLQIIELNKIKGVVNFLNPSKPSYAFYIKFLLISKMKGLDLYYYGHGVNLENTSFWSNNIYNIFHFLYKKIILYTPNEKKYLFDIHKKKTTVAYNTLDLEHRNKLISVSRQELRHSYNYDNELVILFSGRIEKRKKLDLLFDIFEMYEKENRNNIKLHIVGPTEDKNVLTRMQNNTLIKYYGPVYDHKKLAEIFFISDIFSIPGHIGLGLVEAFYWGLPVCTLDVKHAPEIYYLKNNENGYIVNSVSDLSKLFISLNDNKHLRSRLSKSASDAYIKQANINKMIKGFVDALV